MTKIEEVARAICGAQGLDWDAQADGMTSGGGGDNEQEGYIAMAVAAITAMRTMTEQMETDVYHIAAVVELGRVDVRAAWAAGIDAALAEKPL